MSTYYLKARLFPTILTAFPLIIICNHIITGFFATELRLASSYLLAATNISVSAAIIFLLVQINRLVSKEIFQRWFFQDELHMPTVDYLLFSNGYFDPSIKQAIRTKMVRRYSLPLPSESDEGTDEMKARKLIAVVIAMMRNELRTNKMLLQHNIEYGFVRNLIGGSLIALLISFLLVIYGVNKSNSIIQFTGIVLCLIYLFPLLLSKSLIRKYGHYYAKIFFEQFLSLS